MMVCTYMCVYIILYVYIYISACRQISPIPKLELVAVWEDSLTKVSFGVTSAEALSQMNHGP